MSSSPPDPPRKHSADLTSKFDEQSPEALRQIARFAEEGTKHYAREARLAEREEQEEVKEKPKSLPGDVPSKVTITVKESNDNCYYWQWRDGDKIRLKYKRAVDSSR
ncbi:MULTISPECIES: hypothetical protein [Halorussus]|uniref:hypothetical protein n=1 Tax=Halorussus TaxID=1070314 RepID=UPI00209CAF68|nr:hypothetical protein [Halorussus vallis]USZ78294.1 hypothetical protein NGM07_23455 [Halorussus vallis]